MTAIYLHIGTHKTGTTAIQHALKESTQPRTNKHWSYIEIPGAIRSKVMRAEVCDPNLVSELSRSIMTSLKMKSTVRPVVISSEQFSGCPWDGYRNNMAVARILRESTKSLETKVLIYLRRQDQFVESMYAQTIHEGGILSFEDFLSNFASNEALNYDHILSNWAEIFGAENLIVRSYDDSKSRGLINDFSAALNLSGINTNRSMRNPSYSHQALTIAKGVNRSITDDQQRQRLRKALQATIPKPTGESFRYFSEIERDRFLVKYKQSNSQVANRYFDGKTESLFSEISDTSQIGIQETLTAEQVTHLVALLLASEDTYRQYGILAGLRVALKGYPGLEKFIKRILGGTGNR